MQQDIAPFLVKEEDFAIISQPDRFVEALSAGKTVQELFGFSNAVMTCFYRTAIYMLENSRDLDARDAFTFLSTLAPQVSEFWEGLGIANFYLQEYDEAIEAFVQASELEPESIHGFFMLTRTLVEVGRYDDAKQVLDQGINYAQKNSDQAWAKELLVSANELKILVEQSKRSGHS
jgi:tetratricopeptide (TPR) repeat protein